MEPGRHFTDLPNGESQELSWLDEEQGAQDAVEPSRVQQSASGRREEFLNSYKIVTKNVLYPFIRRPAVYGMLGQLKVYDFLRQLS